MKKLLTILVAFVSLSAHAAWVDSPKEKNNLNDFLVSEVGAEGRHQVKVKLVQKDNASKKPLYRVYAVVENSYQEDEGVTQKAITCDLIYIEKEKYSYVIKSWNKDECAIEDVIYLKQM